MYGCNLHVLPVRAMQDRWAWARLVPARGDHAFDWEAWTIDAPDLIPCGSLVHTGDNHLIGFPSAQQRVVRRDRNRTIWVNVNIGDEVDRIEVKEDTDLDALRKFCGG